MVFINQLRIVDKKTATQLEQTELLSWLQNNYLTFRRSEMPVLQNMER
jgi:hypothetical protein